jgi:hypothetical protein
VRSLRRTQPACASERGRGNGFATVPPALHSTRAASRRRLRWGLAALAAIAIVGALQSPVGTSALQAVGAAPAPAGFTEVAMVRAPQATTSGRTLEVAFSVSVHDAQNGDGDYRWKLVTDGSHAVGTAPAGTLHLAAGETGTVDVRARLSCDRGATRTWVGARVDPRPAASVGTWFDCPGARP